MAQVVKYKPGTTATLKVDSAETIAEGQLVGVDAQGEAVLADADAGTAIKALGVAVRAASGAAGDSVTVAMQAVVAGFSSLTPGATQYLSGTAGGITETRPETIDDVIQPVGLAVSATKVVFNVAAPFAVRQDAANSTLA